MQTEKLYSLTLECISNEHWLEALVQKRYNLIAEKFSMQGIDHDMDFQRLRLIVGFITKVRHQPLRRSIPATINLLEKIGIDLEVFANYAPKFVRLKKVEIIDDRSRLKHFSDFLRQFLDCSRREHRIVLDMLFHEQTLHSPRISSDIVPQNDANLNAELIPIKYRLVAVRRCHYNPQEIMNKFLKVNNEFDFPEEKSRFFLWLWDDKFQEVALYPAQPDVGALLSLVNGERTIGKIAEKLSKQFGSVVTKQVIFLSLAEMTELGLITFKTNL